MNRIPLKDQVIEASSQPLQPVIEAPVYIADLPNLLKRHLHGRTFEGRFRPGKEICDKLGLMVLYALP